MKKHYFGEFYSYYPEQISAGKNVNDSIEGNMPHMLIGSRRLERRLINLNV